VVMPEFWSVAQAHDISDEFARKLIQDFGADGEIHLHTDPCRRAYCALCDVLECSIRRDSSLGRPVLKVEGAVL